MIGWLSGLLRERLADRIILDVHGVGYEIQLSKSTFSLLGTPGETVDLHIHTHVREDQISLFGFLSVKERDLFLQLMSVSGIGAKSALAILSALPLSNLVEAIASGNSAALQNAPGIGKKTAERLITELRERVLKISGAELAPSPRFGNRAHVEDVVSALVNLGYKRPVAEGAVARIDLSKNPPFDTILKESLKNLVR